MTELLEWYTDLSRSWLHEERDTRGRWTHGATVPSEPGQERHGYQGKFMGYDPLVPSMAPADGRKPLSQPGRWQGDGTAADPIDVAGDMGKAVALMAAGKHVRLNSPSEIKPLLDEVDRQATAQGYSRAREPGWDLGNISVRGTRLFNEQTRGIPRTAMPQLNGPALPGTEAALLAGGANKFIELDAEFRAQLKRDGIDVRNERVPAGNLRATQTQLTAATVAGITRAAESGNPKVRHMLKEPIWVTRDNYVIDGHHRWASDEALAFSGNGPREIEVQRINLPVRLAIPYANQFAQQMGIQAKPLGNSSLVESATPMELGWKFDPFEKRDVRGRWTKTGAGYVKPDPDRLYSSRATYKMPGDHPFFKANPVSAAHIVDAYDDSDAQERAQGMRWYADAHNLAKKMNHGDIEKNAGVIAALSPQTGWAVNMLNADRSLDLGRALGPGEGMITEAMQRNAQEAIDGEAADVANSSSKTKAFARLIRYGGDEPDDRAGQVVIDRHAMTVAMGKRIPKKEADKAPIGHDRYYQYVADTYRDAALEISKRGTPVSPHQLQAITWLRQQRINEAEDEAHIGMAENVTASRGGRRLSKGRNTMLRNSWQRWQAEAARHKYELIPGTTGPMSEQYANLLSAQVLDFAFNINELRDDKGRWTRVPGTGVAKAVESLPPGFGKKDKRIRPVITAAEARGNSRPVSFDEYQHIAAKGNQMIDKMKRDSSPIHGMDEYWPEIKGDMYAEVRKPWGGGTIDGHTGSALPQGADKYALSVKPKGMHSISIPEHASYPDFSRAMDEAKDMFRPALERRGFYLGIFHDDDLSRIDIDPVAVVDTPEEVEAIGAYTRAIGGAYHFKTGDGYWPPHVAEGAAMATPDTVHFAGPGQWRSQAEAVQAAEPEDDEGEDEPPTISGQVFQFAPHFNPAEKRDPHGRWTRGNFSVGDRIRNTRNGRTGVVTARNAPIDGHVYAVSVRYDEDGKRPKNQAIITEKLEPEPERREQLSLHKILRAAADPFVGAPMPDEPELKAAVSRVATPASEFVPKMYGGSRDEWNGKVKLFEYSKQKELLAFMDWDGTMNAASNVAQALQDGETLTDRPVQFPDAFEVIEHELTHGVVPAGSAKANEAAYQKWAISRIEEGFTELGAIYHAPEFFRKIGLYDREAGPWPGHTVGEMAENMTHPDAITSGNAWGHYEGPTKDAQDWVAQVAQEEGLTGTDAKTRARMVELSDQVNVQGAAGKLGIMSQQLAYAMTKDPKLRADSKFTDDLTMKIADAILHQWNTDNPDGAAKQAFGAARAVALQSVAEKQREMAERAA